ncbi:MAG: hypothetical protein HN878_00490 [Candidatus Diapherotrites archaeon]|jgi:hypothetical protein|nr:hypothetical protein [Candidatus Diapherotrites archaeon]
MKLGELKIATIEEDKKGIIHITLKKFFEITQAEAEEYIQGCLKIAKGQEKAVLFDARAVENFTFMAMKKLVDSRVEDVTKASALLVNPLSPVTSLAVSFVLKLTREPFPIRIFTNKKEALTWLEQFT